MTQYTLFTMSRQEILDGAAGAKYAMPDLPQNFDLNSITEEDIQEAIKLLQKSMQDELPTLRLGIGAAAIATALERQTGVGIIK